MADNGELYKVFPDTFPQGMKKLCAKADLIMPNLTEATLLLGEPYKKGPYTKDYIEGVLKRLSALGPKQVVLTGVYLNEEDLGAASYDRDTGEINYAFHRIIPGYYHGTGDIFGSVIVGCLMNDVPLTRATEIAVDFTCRSIMRTWEARTDVRFGVNFEAGIPKLVQDIGLKPE